MNITISVVVGNPNPASRTLTVARSLAEKLHPDAQIEVVDLIEFADEIFSWKSEKLGPLNERVASSDLVLFATPTYKGTYTGLLKAFLDRYQADGLAGIVAIPVFTGGSEVHSMAPMNLVPLLAELGAIVPGRGFYFIADQMDRLDEAVEAAAAEYRRNFASVAKLA